MAADAPMTPDGKFHYGGVLPGLVAAAACAPLPFLGVAQPGQGGSADLLGAGLFFVAWFGFAGSVSQGTEWLMQRGYTKSVLVTVLSNIVAIGASVGCYVFVMTVVGDDLLARRVGLSARVFSFTGPFVFSLVAYMAPAFVIAVRRSGWQVVRELWNS